MRVTKQKECELARESGNATLGESFVRDCRKENALSKLARYEAGIERSFFRALHELQRLQAARRGQEVRVPDVVDINVDGSGIRP